MRVPFLDLNAHHAPLRAEIRAAIDEVIDRCAFAGGPFVAKFEEEFAAYCQTKYSVAVGNGTDALWLCLLAVGVGPGDEVITVPSTFMATAEAITYCGAKPVFVDVTETTYTMDPAQLEGAITPRTKAILPVHLFGQMADMDPIMAIAKKHGLYVFEDACQAHGAEYKGRRAGSIGHAGCFSFYPGKNLGALGEGGGITTNDQELCGKMQVLRDHGQSRKYHHTVVGWNARMDGIQGAVLSIKLRHLEASNAARRAHAQHYHQLLAGTPNLTLPEAASYGTPVHHVFAVRVPARDRILAGMGERGVACGIHYPIPVHRQEAYAHLHLPEGSFPVAERCAREFLSLPMYPELTPAQVTIVAQELQAELASVTATACAV